MSQVTKTKTSTRTESPTKDVLSVENLVVELDTPRGVIRPVDHVNLRVRAGQSVALVGESGSGKSMTARAIMRLINPDFGGISEGKVKFKGKDLCTLNERAMNSIRGRDIAMVFQDPMAYLNPTMKITKQIGEALRMHKGRGSDTREEISRILRSVGLDDSDSMFAAYPHNLSGGMRQRTLMAIALACGPDLLIADEPTTALDVTIQAQVLQTMVDIQKRTDLGVLFITHDLGVVAQICDYVYVMYAGQIVEHNDVYSLFADPKHPYTRALLDSALSVESNDRSRGLRPIGGAAPDLTALPTGCRFSDRCPDVFEACVTPPSLVEDGAGESRCWKSARGRVPVTLEPTRRQEVIS